MTVSTMLRDYTSEAYLFDTDAGWRQFLVDHKNVIRATSETASVSSELMQMVERDVEAYFRHIGGGMETRMAWIFLIINDLESAMAFQGPMTVYIPRLNDIAELYNTYRTTEA